VRPKDVREIAKAGSSAIPQTPGPAQETRMPGCRIEAVRQITEIRHGGRVSDALILATPGSRSRGQIQPTSGSGELLPSGLCQDRHRGAAARAGSSIKGRFTDTNDQVIDPYVTVRPEVIDALGKLASGGGNMEAGPTPRRPPASCAAGKPFRPGGSPPFQETATRSTNRPGWLCRRSATNRPASRDVLVHDLDPKVQIAAIRTTGLVAAKDALPELADALKRTRDAKVKRAALAAIAMLPRRIAAAYTRSI